MMSCSRTGYKASVASEGSVATNARFEGGANVSSKVREYEELPVEPLQIPGFVDPVQEEDQPDDSLNRSRAGHPGGESVAAMRTEPDEVDVPSEGVPLIGGSVSPDIVREVRKALSQRGELPHAVMIDLPCG